MKNNNKKKLYVTKGSLILRICASAYLLYTVYQLLLPIINGTSEKTGKDNLFIIVAIVLFSISAVVLGITSVKSLIQKNYFESKTDRDEEVTEIQSKIESENEIEEKNIDEIDKK